MNLNDNENENENDELIVSSNISTPTSSDGNLYQSLGFGSIIKLLDDKKIENMNISLINPVNEVFLDHSSRESFFLSSENNGDFVSNPGELNPRPFYAVEIKKSDDLSDYLLNNGPENYIKQPLKGNDNKMNNNGNPFQRKKDNPLFWSTASGVEKKFEMLTIDTSRKNIGDKDKDLLKQEMKKDIAKLIFQKDIQIDSSKVEQIHKMKTEGPARGRKDNPLFYSTVLAANKIEAVPRNDTVFEEFLLPRTVTKILEDEKENIRIVENHITQEKYKVSIDMDQIMNDIDEVLHQQRMLIQARLDNYFEKYKRNYLVLKEKVLTFKEKAKSVYNKEYDLMASTTSRDGMQQTFHPLLQGIQFYKITNEADAIAKGVSSMNKFKEEICNLQANTNAINREVGKRLLLYLSDEVSKQTEHRPLYNNGETLQLSFIETKDNIIRFVKDQLKDYSQDMIYIEEPEDLSSVFAFPKIEAAISDDHLSVIGDSERLINLNMSVEKIVHLNNDQEGKYTCLNSIQPEVVAIGTEQGYVKFYNYVNDTNIGCFQGQGGPVTALTTMKVQLPDISKYFLVDFKVLFLI